MNVIKNTPKTVPKALAIKSKMFPYRPGRQQCWKYSVKPPYANPTSKLITICFDRKLLFLLYPKIIKKPSTMNIPKCTSLSKCGIFRRSVGGRLEGGNVIMKKISKPHNKAGQNLSNDFLLSFFFGMANVKNVCSGVDQAFVIFCG